MEWEDAIFLLRMHQRIGLCKMEADLLLKNILLIQSSINNKKLSLVKLIGNKMHLVVYLGKNTLLNSVLILKILNQEQLWAMTCLVNTKQHLIMEEMDLFIKFYLFKWNKMITNSQKIMMTWMNLIFSKIVAPKAQLKIIIC